MTKSGPGACPGACVRLSLLLPRSNQWILTWPRLEHRLYYLPDRDRNLEKRSSLSLRFHALFISDHFKKRKKLDRDHGGQTACFIDIGMREPLGSTEPFLVVIQLPNKTAHALSHSGSPLSESTQVVQLIFKGNISLRTRHVPDG